VPLELGALYEAYADMIYRLALVRTRNRADAEDVLQDVFFRCLRRQPHFRDQEHQKAWLITAAINSSKSLLDRADRRHGVGPEALEFLSTEDDTDNSVYNAVMQLPEKYRTAVHLFYYEGYSVEEIGKMTDTNPSTVKSHLHRAREALRTVLKEDEPDV
jgi:RNA polymerase sigma-70 factor (ECF subfamily)